MGYFETKNGKTFYAGVDLEKMAQKFGTPTKMVFLDVVENQITFLQKTFQKAIKKVGYNGKFFYYTANKANYMSEMVFTAAKCADGIETSSHYDLLVTKKLIENFKELKNKPILANGFKTFEYKKEIVALHNGGQKILDIVDDLTELNFLLSQNYEKPLEIGVRINLQGLYGHDGEHDRFGMTPSDLKELKQKLKNQNKLKLTTIHFHQRGFCFEEEKFYENILKVCREYKSFCKDFSDLTTIDIGGGTPWDYEDGFDYDGWAEKLLKTFKECFDECGIRHPNIIIENGKYTAKDGIINLYEVLGEKKTNESFSWYVLNASLMLAMPEYYMCGEPMKIVAVNNLEGEKVKTKLAGITCDCDDVFFEKNGYIMLPKLSKTPQIIAILGTGSYQESLTSHKGVRHCLVPAEKRIITFVKNGKREFVEVESVQTIEEVFDAINLNKKYLQNF